VNKKKRDDELQGIVVKDSKRKDNKMEKDIQKRGESYRK